MVKSTRLIELFAVEALRVLSAVQSKNDKQLTVMPLSHSDQIAVPVRDEKESASSCRCEDSQMRENVCKKYVFDV